MRMRGKIDRLITLLCFSPRETRESISISLLYTILYYCLFLIHAVQAVVTMRSLLQRFLFASWAATCHAQFGVQNDRSVLNINNEFSGVCYTYVSVYPVLADYITVTKPYRGSVTALYTVPPQGDEPGIVIVEQPGGSSAPENVVIPATDDREYVIIVRP